MHISASSARGLRDHQEDRYVIHRTPDGYLLAVMDGHGGSGVAQACKEYLPLYWDISKGNPYTERLRYCVLEADLNTNEYQTTGSTLAIAFIEHGEQVLDRMPNVYVATLGDSLILISRPDGLVHVGPQHNVRSNLEERDAAIARGGYYEGGYIRKWNGVGLQMSRALGDGECGDIISREPDIYVQPLWSWVLLATDGLVDPNHTSTATGLGEIIDEINCGSTAETLVAVAVEDNVTEDNATAILYRR